MARLTSGPDELRNDTSQRDSSSRHVSSSLQMHEVDPEPIADNDDNLPLESPDTKPPSQTIHSPPTSTKLGLGSHSTAWYLSRIQRYSSYTFSVFAAFHITNTSLIPLLTRSVPASDPYLLLTRPYYQSWPLAEPLIIIGSLTAHIGSGIALRLHRRRQDVTNYGADERSWRRRIAWPKVSGTSKLGYLLMPAVLVHAWINRVIPVNVSGGSSTVGLGYVAHGFAKHPVVANVGYAFLVGVGVWHFVWGAARYFDALPSQITFAGEAGRRDREKRWYVLNATSFVVAAVWLAGGLGVVGRGGLASGWIGREYDELYKSIPLVGHWF